MKWRLASDSDSAVIDLGMSPVRFTGKTAVFSSFPRRSFFPEIVLLWFQMIGLNADSAVNIC